MPAHKLEQVYSFFKNRPVNLQNFEELYAPADRGRGKSVPFQRIKRRLYEDPEGSLKMLFAGHKGCGKTTEMVRLQRDIQDDFVVLNFSAVKELDILNIGYIEIFIAAMSKLFQFVEEEKDIQIAPIYLKNILNWLKSREIEEINEKYMGMGMETEAGGGVDIPFLAKFFARFSASAKSSSSLKEVLKQKVEPKLSDLIFHCNRLITEIKNQRPGNKNGLVIIFEDLDKMDLQKGEEIFYRHAVQLTQLHCHCIFTFPLALLYNTGFNAIKVSYDEDFVLPMIKVYQKEGGENPDGMQVMEEIVKKRMDLSLFEDISILKDMIRYSGGCLWDLFEMIKDASDSALDFGREKINREDYQSAFQALKRTYEFTIAENKAKGITVDQYFETLKSCAMDANKKPKSTDILLDLRNNRTVLSYNDVHWSDVHPVVRAILQEKGLIPHA